jgi:hypothetical protein
MNSKIILHFVFSAQKACGQKTRAELSYEKHLLSAQWLAKK